MASSFKELIKNVAFRSLYVCNVQKGLRSIKLRENRITVLCLHRVSTEYDHFWDPIKPDTFEQLISYLVKNYDVIPVEKIGEKPGKRPRAILSFDDGYYDFYTNVLPLLKHYSLPANHNIVTDIVNGKQDVIWTEKLNFLFNHFRIDAVDDTLKLPGIEFNIKEQQANLDGFYIKTLQALFKLDQRERLTILDGWLGRYNLRVPPKKMMGWSEIMECQQYGVEFGSHTKTHPVLSAMKNENELRSEIFESKSEIEKNLNREISILAPPNGMCDQLVLNLAKEAGYKYVLGIGDHCELDNKGEDFTFMTRLNLISEPHSHMVLRIEEIQSNLKKYAKRLRGA